MSKTSPPNKYTYDFVKSQFEIYGYKLLNTTYENQTKNLDLECNEGHPISMSYYSLKTRKHKECPKCNGIRQPLTFDDVKKSYEDHDCTLL